LKGVISVKFSYTGKSKAIISVGEYARSKWGRRKTEGLADGGWGSLGSVWLTFYKRWSRFAFSSLRIL